MFNQLRINLAVLGSVLLAFAVGCSSSDSASSGGGGVSMDEAASQIDAQQAARERAEADAAAKQKADDAAAAAAAAQTPPEPEVVTARSPKRGQSLQGGGYLSVVTGTRFWAEHQIILNNIHHAMRLYEAEKGRYPKTQDEFMRDIIEPNLPATALPELPDGYEYYYDPKEPLVLKMVNTGTGQPGAID